MRKKVSKLREVIEQIIHRRLSPQEIKMAEERHFDRDYNRFHNNWVRYELESNGQITIVSDRFSISAHQGKTTTRRYNGGGLLEQTTIEYKSEDRYSKTVMQFSPAGRLLGKRDKQASESYWKI